MHVSQIVCETFAIDSWTGMAVVCPLTRDYGFFKWAVQGLSPGSVQVQGTLIGDAVRKIAAERTTNPELNQQLHVLEQTLKG